MVLQNTLTPLKILAPAPISQKKWAPSYKWDIIFTWMLILKYFFMFLNIKYKDNFKLNFNKFVIKFTKCSDNSVDKYVK